LGKILKFKKGGQEEAPLGLVYYEDTTDTNDRLKYDPDINKYLLFRTYRHLKFEYNKYPTLDNRTDLHVKKDRKTEFINYSWEFDLLELIYSINTRPFKNEDLKILIPKLNRVAKATKEIREFLEPKIDKTKNTKPKRTLGDMRPQSIDEVIKEMKITEDMARSLATMGEEDIKLKKSNRPPTVLSILYPVQILTKIYNCLDRKEVSIENLKTFIHQEIINLPSLKDLEYITIENAIKQSKKTAFQFQDLINATEEELERIWNFILKKN
jgi:hypothetical protein